jgi:hypothetical protein
MPTLLVDCPYTNRKFSTGVEATAESLRVLWKARIEVNCPHCHKTHSIRVREAYLEGALKDALARRGAETEMMPDSIPRKDV